MIETILSSGLFGGITGLIGTIFSAYNQRKLKELDLKEQVAQRTHELAMVQAESDAMLAEAEARIQVTSSMIAGEIEKAETQAFVTSLESGQKSIFDVSYMTRLFEIEGWKSFITIPAGVLLAILFGFVAFVKEFARPGITTYLLIVSTWITVRSWALLDKLDEEVLNAALAFGIVSDAINIVLYLTVTAVTWWFGDRMASKGLAKSLGLRGR